MAAQFADSAVVHGAPPGLKWPFLVPIFNESAFLRVRTMASIERMTRRPRSDRKQVRVDVPRLAALNDRADG